MFDFGTTNQNANRVHYGDIAAMDAPASYTFACTYRYVADPAGFVVLFAKSNSGSSLNGYYFYLNATRGNVGVWHADASAGSFVDDGFIAQFARQVHHLVVTWNGALASFYHDGVLHDQVQLTRAITANSESVGIGNVTALNRGINGQVGQCIFWSGVVFDEEECEALADGERVRWAQRTFYVSGTASPGTEEISSTAGTVNGTVNLYASSPPDSDYASIASEPSGLLSSAMLTEVQGRSRVFFGFELDLLGTTYKLARKDNPIASVSRGPYLPRITSWTPRRQAASLSSLAIDNSSQMTVIVEDKDKTFTRLLEGAARSSWPNSAARAVLFSDFVATPEDDFAGILTDVEVVSPVPEIAFTVRTNDRGLNQALKIPLATRNDFPTINDNVSGERLPFIYGIHNSENSGGIGAVQGVLIDPISRRWFAGLSYLRIRRVWADASQTTAIDWTYGWQEANGRSFTTIVPPSGVALTAAITFDVDGVSDRAELTDFDTSVNRTISRTIVNPVRQLAHLLKNLVFGSWLGGAWLTTSPYVDDSDFAIAARWAALNGLRGRRVFYGDETGIAAVNEFAECFQMACYWKNNGKLGIAPLDTRVVSSGVYSAQLFDLDARSFDKLTVRSLSDGVGKSVAVGYNHDRGGSALFTLVPQDPDVPFEQQQNIGGRWLDRPATWRF